MDDRFAYMLNSLWTRHYELGRIVRFRRVTRGRQAECFEILTGEQNEYAAYLYPPAYEAQPLARIARTLDLLDKERFSVCPMLQARTGEWVVSGPQNTHMMVGISPAGQYLLPDQWTDHDISQLGLRLAWLHRLLPEQLGAPPQTPLAADVAAALKSPDNALLQALASDPAATGFVAALDTLQEALAALPPASGWCHGDLQPAAILLDDDHQIRTLVDWGLLHPGDPLEDLVDVFVHWCCSPAGTVNTDRGRLLLEAYRSLRDAGITPWSHAVTAWAGHRLLDAAAGRRPIPRGFIGFLSGRPNLAAALELCETR